MKLQITNNFDKDDICLSEFEYIDKDKKVLLKIENKFFCERYGDGKTNIIFKDVPEKIRLQTTIIKIKTIKKIGSKAI